MQNRLEILRKFVAEEPQDPFNHYALATELLKTNKKVSKGIFEDLIQNYPDYLPTYYHLGALYVELCENNAAEQTYLQGIELAKRLNNEKTLKELKGAYQMFLDEMDE
jgi:tetratricopeptide (TPR) repeat protein